MSQTKYDEWFDIVSKTVRFVTKDFPDVEYDDLFQDVMAYVLGNRNLKNPDGAHVSTGLYKKAVKFAWEYRKQSLYITSQYSYRTSDVKKILETLFDYREWTTSFIPDDAKSLSEDDRLVVNSDIKKAFDSLSDEYKQTIYSRYALNILPESTNAKRNLNRAIATLTDYINFYQWGRGTEGPGQRKPITNATANYIIGNQNGD
jgi:hypothetical protein